MINLPSRIRGGLNWLEAAVSGSKWGSCRELPLFQAGQCVTSQGKPSVSSRPVQYNSMQARGDPSPTVSSRPVPVGYFSRQVVKCFKWHWVDVQYNVHIWIKPSRLIPLFITTFGAALVDLKPQVSFVSFPKGFKAFFASHLHLFTNACTLWIVWTLCSRLLFGTGMFFMLVPKLTCSMVNGSSTLL